ncbi:hypothetical protein DyAD56_18670 [Dyella sp. AD56]|uniref:hypothetical protein n=1 Tax=Dyella sp. AD56 TaxID=1528744 RepID=UPI000C859837|nr:hypothetical protein [Dyella sp. AD56]PMQ03730.1 hypothetical protein DyAD56_18670 [Dyella sp. AD56]
MTNTKVLHARLGLIILIPLALVGCSSRNATCQAKIDMLKPLMGRDSHADVQQALKAHDLRFLGIYDFSIDVPGMDAHKDAVRERGIKMIEGTTDAPCDEEHGKMIKDVRRYAESYNLELFNILSGEARIIN